MSCWYYGNQAHTSYTGKGAVLSLVRHSTVARENIVSPVRRALFEGGMMRIEKDKCDQCGKEVLDRYVEPGWIQLEGEGTMRLKISISIRRSKNKLAQSAYKTVTLLDFCCMGCLTSYLTNLYEEARAKLDV